MVYDVIITGAGPAGSSAAYYLASAGLNVLLLDKSAFPRLKVCAGGLPPHVNQYNFKIDGIIESKCNKVIYSFKGKSKVELDFGTFTIDMIMRKEFDYFLLNRAKSAGTKVQEKEILLNAEIKNDIINLFTDKNTYKCKYLIGADGALSKVNQIFNIVGKHNIGVTVNAEVRLKPEKFKDFVNTVYLDMGDCSKGYFWSFPKKEHVSIGMGSLEKKYPNFKKIFLKNFKNINIKDDDIISISDLKGAPLPYFNKKEKLNKGNILLTGDAANLVDSLSGEGIFYAIKSGELSAKSIINAENKKNTIDNYNFMLKDIIQNLEYSKKFADIFFKYPKISYYLGVRNKMVNNLFKEMVTSNKTYADLYKTVKSKFSKKFRYLINKKNKDKTNEK